jgi:4-cresol dehydrogenase (hydroxylating) flavoprotein subunit
MNANFEKAIGLWQKAIGEEYVIFDAAELKLYEANASAIERKIPAVLKPATAEEVQNIVKIANECGTPLYPISKGRNWGYGSRIPTKDNTVVVDLGRMNRIRNVSEFSHNNPYLILEPGVTQKQLFQFLKDNNLPFTFNVSAAGNETSIIGNGLERGVGYWGSRTDELSSLEIVLGTGEIIQTGYGHIPNAKAKYCYPYGIGPSLDGLFYQSNYGIVTSAAFRLTPKFEYSAAMLINIFDDSKLEQLVEAVGDLRIRGILQSVTHIANKERTITALAPRIYQQLVQEGHPRGNETKKLAEELLYKETFGEWNCGTGLTGSKKQVLQNYNLIKDRVSKFAKTVLLTEKKIQTGLRVLNALSFIPALKRKHYILHAAEPFHGFSLGIPSDDILPSFHWTAGHIDIDSPDLDHSPGGILFCNPAIPLNGVDARKLVTSIRTVFGKYHFEPVITLNVKTPNALVCVINVSFDRSNPEETKRGILCSEECLNDLISLGFYPYRSGVQSMPSFLDKEDKFWLYVKDLKKVLDPNHIISPGRYNLV